MPAKKLVRPLLLIIILVVAGSMLVGQCSYFAGMGASLTDCDCLGHQLLLYDRTAADGPRKSICIGLIRSVECYQYVGGPPVECEI